MAAPDIKLYDRKQVARLLDQLPEEEEELSDEGKRLLDEGHEDLDAGRVHSAAEVRRELGL